MFDFLFPKKFRFCSSSWFKKKKILSYAQNLLSTSQRMEKSIEKKVCNWVNRTKKQKDDLLQFWFSGEADSGL